MRIISFALIFGICYYLVWQIGQLLGYTLDMELFLPGLILATAIGFVWFVVSVMWSTAVRPFRPQTVMLSTNTTPAQIGCRAMLAIIFLLLIVGIVVYAYAQQSGLFFDLGL